MFLIYRRPHQGQNFLTEQPDGALNNLLIHAQPLNPCDQSGEVRRLAQEQQLFGTLFR